MGAVWQGINPRGAEDSNAIRSIIKLPEHIKPFSLVAVGHPAEIAIPEARFNESRVHYSSAW